MTVVTATLLSGGTKIKRPYELLSVDVRREVNRIPRATLMLADGDAAEGAFPMSESGDFAPGTEIEIRLRCEAKPGEDISLFKGPVVRHGIEAGPDGSLLRVELYDKAVRLTQGRRSAVFSGKTDKAMIEEVAKAYGVKTAELADNGIEHPQMVQFNATGWDFILSRAEANGLWVLADEGRISTVDPKKPPADGGKHKISYGDNVYELEFEADARGQQKEVKASGWDPAQQKPTEPVQGAAFRLSQGDFEEDALAAVAGETCLLSDPVPFAKGELQAWASAQVMRSRMAFIRGRVSTEGSAAMKLLDKIEIRRVGGPFEGETLVTGVCHRVDVDGWRTDLQFGLSARSFALEEGISDAPAAGLLPPARGLHVGVVADFKDDPEFRVQVILPGIDPKKEAAVWARLAAPDAGKNRGWFFRPEKGDEVVLGFFNDDPRQPVILGGLFSSKNVLPESVGALAQENKTRAIVSRSGTTLGFIDDDKGSVFIKTKSGARLLIDDGAKSIELSDQNGNQLKMDENGITLKTGKDLKLQADGNVEIKGAKVDIK